MSDTSEGDVAAEDDDNNDPNESESLPKHSIAIHLILDEAQSSHGLSHDDYEQYRSYCSRRLSRLRSAKALGGDLKQAPSRKQASSSKKGKSTTTKSSKMASTTRKTIPASDAVKHENYCLTSLFEAERAWSHAMEMKLKYEAKLRTAAKGSGRDQQSQDVGILLGGGDDKVRSSPGAIRHHYLRRLNRASHFATTLEARAIASCDIRTFAEARAYASWMRGNLALETSKWKVACTEFAAAITISRCLGRGDHILDEETTSGEDQDEDAEKEKRTGSKKATSSLEMRDFFSERAGTVIEPLLRYCQYELQEEGMKHKELADLMSSTEKSELRLLASTLQQQREDSSTDYEALLLGSSQNRNSLGANEAGQGGGASVRFRSRDIEVENRKLRVALLKLSTLKSDLLETKGENGAGSDGEAETVDEEKFLGLLTEYDDALAIVSADHKELMGMKSGPAVIAKRFEAESLMGYLRYQKLSLLMKRNEGMVDRLRKNLVGDASKEGARRKCLTQVVRLYDTLLQDARTVVDLPGGSPPPSDEDEEQVEDEFRLEAKANVLRLRALRCFYLAQMYALSDVGMYAEAVTLFDHAVSLSSEAAEEIAACEDIEGADDLIQSMADLEREASSTKFLVLADAHLSAGNGGAFPPARSLLERLDDYDDGDDKVIAHLPPRPLLAPGRPTFFDIAWNHVGEFPSEDLAAHIAAHKKKEPRRGLFGWFGGSS